MSSSTPNLCFNSSCKEVSDNWRRGWRRRTGDYAHLCDRCASVYEDGKFCETFHLNASGWRCCESCGKQIHCGCIVSFHMFVLLDAGGIECLTCAKKSYILTPNPAWPPPSHFFSSQPEKTKDLSVKYCSSIAGSGPVPWRQAPNLFFGSDTWSNAHPRGPFEVDASGSIDRYHSCDRPSPVSCEMRQQRSYDRLISGNLRPYPSEASQSRNAGINMKEQSYGFLNDLKREFPNNYSSSNLTCVPTSSRIEADNTPLSALLSQSQAISIPPGKSVNHSGMDSSVESQIRNGKVRVDARGRNQLLPRYRPQITNEELQQISSNSKSAITPLFEKMLSASDAGRIGRLVLPKKCAETYFPSIAQPEGLPLQVLDVKGKEWVFQFRFWPNNNSRMYVLEGITPCIQSMQLQAGDVVTFSRLEPEGKLVMGGRKASAIPSSDQGDGATVTGNDASNLRDSGVRNNCVELISINGDKKDKILDDNPSIHIKRRNGGLGTTSKRLRFEEDMIELKLTWKEAQGLIRPPDDIVSSFVVVEGCEFEEFEEAEPIIGRPTLPGVDHFGEKIQWVQCEDCFKWRRVPVDALLPSRWICADNVWDLDRSNCSATEDLAKEQLDHMLLALNEDSSKREITDQDSDLVVPPEGLDTLANLAIQDEGEGLAASSENRTKHPHHKIGCTCIVCLQPSCEGGSKHKQSCDCILCSSLRFRFKILMERQAKKLSEREAEPPAQNSPKQQQSLEKVQEDLNPCPDINTLILEDARNSRKPFHLPLKGQIDLNIQPEREEESSPGSDSGPMKQHIAFFRQERPLDTDALEI